MIARGFVALTLLVACKSGDPAPAQAPPFVAPKPGSRLTLDASFTTLEVGKPVDAKLASAAKVVVIAAPSAAGAEIERALLQVPASTPTLVAIRTEAGPVFAGMRTAPADLAGANVLEIDPKADPAYSCVGDRMVGMAARRVPDALDVLFTSIKNECARSGPCGNTVAVGLGGTSTGEDLASVAAAAGRANVEHVVIGIDLPCPRH